MSEAMDLNRPIFLFMHAGSGNHGCEAIVDSTLRMIADCRKKHGADTDLPVVLATNNIDEDRKYILGDLEKQGLCTIIEERHIDRDFIAHVFYYGWRLISGDKESFLRYRFREALQVYENKCREKNIKPYEAGENGLKPLAVSIGGDNYCYPEMVGDLILGHSMFRKKGFETVLWGCSIEPDSLRDPDLLQDLIAYDHIYAREPITYEALLNAGISADRLTMRRDPAFDLKTAEIELPEWFKPGNTVGINLSPMIQARESKKGIVKQNYFNFVEFILEKTDQNIALIPHVVWPSSDDRQTLKILYDAFKDSQRVFMVEDAPAEVLKGYISKCSFFVGARTHSTIAAYSSGVPTLVMGYSVKSRGIATDLFGGYENYVIPVQEIEDPFALVRSYEWIRSR